MRQISSRAGGTLHPANNGQGSRRLICLSAMPRKFFRKYLPSRESIRQNRHIARFGTLFLHPNLWHVNRRSVAGGVAAGMFAGLGPGMHPWRVAPSALLAPALLLDPPVPLVLPPFTNPLTVA